MNRTTHQQPLTQAYIAWKLGEPMRRRRQRLKRYTFGDQWADTVTDPASGATMTERALKEKQGVTPATNNIIRQLVKTVVGSYRSLRKEQRDADPKRRADRWLELDARTFEEFLISGCAIQRVVSRRQPGGEGVTAAMEQVSPRDFFIGAFSDPDGSDVELIGRLHTLTLQQIVLRHAHSGESERIKAITEIYQSEFMRNASRSPRLFGESDGDPDGSDFYHAPGGLCRLIEVWTLETAERLRCHDTSTGRFFYAAPGARLAPTVSTRCELVAQWHCRFYAPTGELIDSYIAPRHPYSFRFYPWLDGEIHSFVEDIIEQQRNINRLLTLNDRILSTAAKGVLLFPDNQRSREMPLDQVAQRWAQPDGLVLYRGLPGLPPPQQIISSPGNLGVSAMVEQHLRLISEVAGVSAAMRGEAQRGDGTSAQLYESRYRNSLVAMSDIFDSFDSFIDRRDRVLAAHQQ